MERKLELDYSKMQCFKNCRRMYYWQYVKGYRFKVFEPALSMGTIFHKGLSNFYTHNKQTVKELVNEYRSQLINASHSPEQVENIENMLCVVTAILMCYDNVYVDDMKKYHDIVSEEKIGVQIEDNWLLYGTPDMICKDISNNYVLFENKTAGTITSAYLEKLPLDTQITTYCYMLERMAKLPKHIVYNVVRKPRTKRKNGESWDQYESRLIDTMMTKPEDFFYREDLMRDDTMLKNFGKEVEEVFSDIERCYLNPNKMELYYPNTASCTYFAGCRYLKLCTLGEDNGRIFYSDNNKETDGIGESDKA